jgi:hypothetical protein
MDTRRALIRRYAAAHAAKPRNPEARNEIYKPRPELLGTWEGTVRTWKDTITLKLIFQADGNIHVKFGDQFGTLLDVCRSL